MQDISYSGNAGIAFVILLSNMCKHLLPFFLSLLPFFSLGQNRDLNYFIDQSLQNNPKIFELRNQVLQNKLDSQLIVAGNKWQVSGNGNAYYAPIINGWGYDMAITNGQQLSALVAVSKQIYNKRNLGLLFNSLQLQNDSLLNSSAISKQDIKKAIITQYITTYGDQLQLDFNDELIQLLTREEELLKQLTQKNVYKQADYLTFLVTLQQQQLARNQLFVQYKNDYASLNYLAGIVDTTVETLSEPEMHVIPNYQPTESAYFLKYKIDSLRIENERSITSVQYRPKVNLFADAGYQSSFILTPYKNFGYNFGINLTIPIYDGHQKELQFSKLDIQQRTLQKKQDFFDHQYHQQLQQLQQQLNDIENLRSNIHKQIGYLETLIKVDGKLLETGDIRITDYILALNNYITAKNLVVQNQIARYQVIQQINYWNMKL
ncbi:MAG: TolC family protein [Bacteroidota bacterium]|nr:TolC family protein [Bacteroidota bacterium]